MFGFLFALYWICQSSTYRGMNMPHYASSGSFAGRRHFRIPLGYYYSALKNSISYEYQKRTSNQCHGCTSSIAKHKGKLQPALFK
jgi:hypothetical protein